MSLTPEQMDRRKRVLTASQVPAVLGKSPYTTAYLMAKNKQEDKSNFSSEAMEAGHDLEEPVAKLCAAKKRLNLDWDKCYLAKDLWDILQDQGFLPPNSHCDGTLFCPQEKIFGATSDYIFFEGVDKEVINYEIKTSNKPDGWKGGSKCREGVPEHIWIQVQWQMFIIRSIGLDCRRTAVGALLASRPNHRWINYDHSFISSILDRCFEFQDNCNNGILPKVKEYKRRLQPQELPQNYDDAINESIILKDEIDRLTAKKKALDEGIFLMAERLGPATSSEGHAVSIRKEYVSTIVPRTKIMGDIIERFAGSPLEHEINAIIDRHSFTKVSPARAEVRRKRRSKK